MTMEDATTAAASETTTTTTMSTEHKALIGFAARLGTCVSHEDGIANEVDLQSEAQLLMDLLSSNPSMETATVIEESLNVVRPYFDEEPSSEEEESSTSSATSTSTSTFTTSSTNTTSTPTINNNGNNNNSNNGNGNGNTETNYSSSGAFSFSCPSLSLDGKSPLRSRLPSSDSSSNSTTDDDSTSQQTEATATVTTPTPAPIVSMGRPLVVDDRDALRLSADSMARNILRTFQRAVKWRKQCWIDTLARPLVDEERKRKAAGATQDELRELLETPIALVIASLNQTSIEVLDARTSFRVLPQRWEKTSAPSPTKKRKVATSNATTATHVLSFQTVLNISSPAGYSQVTLDAPGFIEGKFSTNNNNNDDDHHNDEATLTGVSVEVDTRVLAAMIEKSSRIIARASAEVFMNPYPEFTDSEGASIMASPHPTTTATEAPRRLSTSSAEDTSPTIVTPRMKSPSTFCDDLELVKKACIPLVPDDLDNRANHKRAILRMVSPQPPGSSNSSVDEAPPRIAAAAAALVSPPGRMEYLTFDGGPSLPALVEVACAEMRTN